MAAAIGTGGARHAELRVSSSLYAALALLRLGLTLSPGYVHPDEHFQALEPAATLVGWQSRLPWEFDPSPSPVRSWLGALLAAWPLWLLWKVGARTPSTAWASLHTCHASRRVCAR